MRLQRHTPHSPPSLVLGVYVHLVVSCSAFALSLPFLLTSSRVCVSDLYEHLKRTSTRLVSKALGGQIPLRRQELDFASRARSTCPPNSLRMFIHSSPSTCLALSICPAPSIYLSALSIYLSVWLYVPVFLSRSILRPACVLLSRPVCVGAG